MKLQSRPRLSGSSALPFRTPICDLPSAICALLAALTILAVECAMADTGNANVISTQPVYVPDLSHEMDPLDSKTMAWDATAKSTNVPANTAEAKFVFTFTNVSKGPVVIVDAHPSCSCTSAQLPPLPWTITSGATGQIGVTVDLAGKWGMIVKSVRVATDKGTRDLVVQISMLPPKIPVLTDADRVRQMAIARGDRQAVFKNDCVTCHVKNGEDRYGKALYDADCGICHDAKNRASMVPDLHTLKVPTNYDFWHVWIEHGKPGTFMPAFSTGDGGPLSDMQINSLAAYLNAVIPSPKTGLAPGTVP